MIKARKTDYPRFPDPDYCKICGGSKQCLKGKAVDKPLRRRVDCPEGRRQILMKM